MSKRIFLTLTILAAAFLVKAQTWGTYGTGLSFDGHVLGITEYAGNLYVDGIFTTAGGNPANNIAEWNGSSWSFLGTGLDNYGYCLTVYNGNLYAGGTFDSAGGHLVHNIAKWNGTSWSSLGSGTSVINGIVNCMAVYNGNLYAGGVFDSAGGQPANCIAEWNGSAWSPVGRGLTDSTPGYIEVNALAVYNGELYAAGIFDSAGGVHVNDIAKWNGTSWSAAGGGITGTTYPWSTFVSALCVYDGDLYAGGTFDSAGGIPVAGIAKWDGTNWSPLNSKLYDVNGASVSSLAVFNHELFVGGNFRWVEPHTLVNYITQWDGNQFYPLTTGTNLEVASLGSYNSSLVVGGQFTGAGGTSCSDIAYWIGGPLAATGVCYVTVDTASKYNEILWDKTGVDTNLVDSIRIYSKGFSGYKYIGHVSIHNFTQFVDSTSQPNTVSSYYEISSVDTSGLISQLSAYNQTILLQASVGVGNVVNLTWNAYKGDSVSYYVILRDSTGSNKWQRLDSVANTTYAYTDTHPPVSSGNGLRYMIITVWSLNCVPYSNSPIVRHEAMSANQVYSRSNRKPVVITGIPTINSMPSVAIYPNPSKDIVTITLSQPEDATITLNDVLGQMIYTDKLSGNQNIKQINLSGVKDGIYFLKLTLNNGGEIVKKIEVVR